MYEGSFNLTVFSVRNKKMAEVDVVEEKRNMRPKYSPVFLKASENLREILALLLDILVV